MKLHELKIHPDHFSAITFGFKAYEIRYNDRDYQLGDILFLREFIKGPQTETYTGNTMLVRVKHVLTGFEGLEPGFIIMGINEIIDRPIL